MAPSAGAPAAFRLALFRRSSSSRAPSEGRLRPRGRRGGGAATGARWQIMPHVTFVPFLLFVPSAIGVLPRAHGTALRSSIWRDMYRYASAAGS